MQGVTSCSFMDFTLALEALAEERREAAGDSLAGGIWNTSSFITSFPVIDKNL